MNRLRLQGRDIHVFKTGEDGRASAKALACAESCEVRMSTRTEKITDKDTSSTGVLIAVEREWSINTSHAMASMKDYEELVELWKSGEPVTLAYNVLANISDSAVDDVDGKVWKIAEGGYYGKAVITELTLSAQSGQKATFSATFTGSGELKKHAAA